LKGEVTEKMLKDDWEGAKKSSLTICRNI